MMMKKKALKRTWSAALVLLLVGIFIPASSGVAAGAQVFLLADEVSAGTTALETAFTTAGHTMTRMTPEFTWNGTNPELTGFECVVHLNGETFQNPLPVPAQQALESFVSSGQGGFIGSQWNGFEFSAGQQVNMPNLVLQVSSAGVGPGDQSYTAVAGQEGHPVLAGVPPSFVFFADAHDAGPAVSFATQPSTVLMTATGGGPGVIVREFMNGRVVNFSHAANFGSFDATLQDPNIQQLYLNAVAWACPTTVVPEPPVVTDPPSQDPVNEAELHIRKARVKLNHKKAGGDKVKVEGYFEAFVNGDGTDRLPGDVTVTFGGYSQTIAAEAFVRDEEDFTYRDRSKEGAITRLTIKDDGRFKVVAKHLDLQDIEYDAVAFYIAMGADYGEASITLNHRGRFRAERHTDRDKDKDRGKDSDDD